MSNQRVFIPGSDLKLRAGDRWVSDVDPGAEITATIMLRRPSSDAQDLLSGNYHALSREQAEQSIAANPQDLAAVRSFAEEHGMKITEEDPAARRIRVTATAKQMEDTFGVQIGTAEDASGSRYLTYKGSLTMPATLAGVVVAVLGLDQRSIARHADPL